MANLFKASGGVIGSLAVPETWTAPNGLFPTTDRNDGSVYTWASSTSTVTLPSSGLADGYLIIGAFEYDDSSNGRFNPQGKIVQASGTGNFVGGPTGGYLRDNSEDRAYVRAWAFVDNPSASATFQFQWKADTDDAGATDGTARSEIQVIPLYYSNIGMYTSTSASLYGGTTPNQVTGWAVTHESDTAAIEHVSNVVTVKGDNKRYLLLGSQFFEGRGGRTQRWHGFEIDGTKEDGAKAYSYYRNGSNDENGELFTHLLETATANVTVEQFCYRGDGVASGQGGADSDGSTPGVGDHSMVVIELNDSAEVFQSTGSTNQNMATAGPVDMQATKTTDVNINDSASFTRSTDTAMDATVSMDALLGANISGASQAITSGQRWTAYGEFTINGTEDSDSFAGDYLRNQQSTTDTFGWSGNLLGFEALTSGDDIGVSVTELSGTEGGGGAIHTQTGWVGFWGINLDSLATTNHTISPNDISLALSEDNTTVAETNFIIASNDIALGLNEDVATIDPYPNLDGTYEDKATLPTTDTALANTMTAPEKGEVLTDDNTYFDLAGSNYLIENFLYDHTNNTDEITVTAKVKSTLAPTSSTIYLQIYNYNTPAWETLDSDSTTVANTELTLTGSKTTSLSDYYTTGDKVLARVYQEVV